MDRRSFLRAVGAGALVALVPTSASAAETTADDALAGVIHRYPVLTGMRITYGDHPGLSLWPGKYNGVRDYRTVELWTGYSYAQYPDALHHELGHALNYWAGVARREPARLLETAVGPVAYDSVLEDFWRVRGFASGSPYGTYVAEEVARRRMAAAGVQQFAGNDYYYQFTPAEQFANCFASVSRGLSDESQLGNFHTQTWGIPLDRAALDLFFAGLGRTATPAPPSSEFTPADYRGESVDGSATAWYSELRRRIVFFLSGREV